MIKFHNLFIPVYFILISSFIKSQEDTTINQYSTYLNFGLNTCGINTDYQHFNFILSNPSFPANHRINLSPNYKLYGIQVFGFEVLKQKNGVFYSYSDFIYLFNDDLNAFNIKLFGIGKEKTIIQNSKNRSFIKFRAGIDLNYLNLEYYDGKGIYSSTKNNLIINNTNLTNSMHLSLYYNTFKLTPFLALNFILNNHIEIRFSVNYNLNIFSWERIYYYGSDYHTHHTYKHTYSSGSTTNTSYSPYLVNENGNVINNIFSMNPLFFKINLSYKNLVLTSQKNKFYY